MQRDTSLLAGIAHISFYRPECLDKIKVRSIYYNRVKKAMETIKISTTIKSDGHLKIDVPTSLDKGEVEVILIIENKRKQLNKYYFSDLAGKLQWNGNPVETQRALRNEWQ